jgi:hypothetical protein
MPSAPCFRPRFTRPEFVAQCGLRTRSLSPDPTSSRRSCARGRAVDNGLSIEAGPANLPPELTITVDGAFWSPFGPTIRGGRLDTDLLLTRTTRPLSIPTAAMLRVAGAASSSSISDLPKIC